MIRYRRRMVFFVPSHQSEARPPICTRIVIRYTLLPNMATSNFVFLNQDGHDLLRGNRHWFEDAIAEAGIRDFTWHDLRHTFASRLIVAGIGIRNVQDLMGHKTINMTARYAHLEPEQQLEAVEHLLVGFGSKSRMRIVRKKAEARATRKRVRQAVS